MNAMPANSATMEGRWQSHSRAKIGMACFIAAESAIFASLVVAYLFYLGKSASGPAPRTILQVPVLGTVCLLSSSFTMHRAVAALRNGRKSAFRLFWAITLALGLIFIGGTGLDWHRLIVREDFTIDTNLFGAGYYSLVGLHAFHVIAGVIGLAIVLVLSLLNRLRREHFERCAAFSLYWHFVDAVWVIVFITVYIVGR